jgi:hypothetical protein
MFGFDFHILIWPNDFYFGNLRLMNHASVEDRWKLQKGYLDTAR